MIRRDGTHVSRPTQHRISAETRSPACVDKLIVERVYRYTATKVYNSWQSWEGIMKWVDPAYSDLRLGFEVTAYAYVR